VKKITSDDFRVASDAGAKEIGMTAQMGMSAFAIRVFGVLRSGNLLGAL